ncbi:hypothetical protein NKG94_31175 [Micromonospora sp. M12]
MTLSRVELPSPELNRYLYAAVGGDWFWLDRLTWNWQQWYDWLDRPGVETWLATVRGTPSVTWNSTATARARWKLPTSASCRHSSARASAATC